MRGRPFVLLSVNSDSKKRLRRAIQTNGLNWRSWWDGGSTSGPIARQFDVEGWPTLFVIDQHGVIRHRDLFGASLEQAIESLLAQQPARAAE